MVNTAVLQKKKNAYNYWVWSFEWVQRIEHMAPNKHLPYGCKKFGGMYGDFSFALG